jgi:type IV secretory pathway VirB9-like protein
MKQTRLCSVLSLVFLCGPLVASQSSAAKRSTSHAAAQSSASESGKNATASGTQPPDAEPGAKVIAYGDKDVVKLRTKLRYTTLIVLPKNEQILDFTCGDKEYWVVNGTQNFAYIKPARERAETNLNLITASGNVYSFMLAEVSETPGAMPDLKVFIEPKEDSMVSAVSAAPKFVSAQVVEDYRQQVNLAREETRQVKQTAQAAIDSGVSKFLDNVRFPYRFEAGKKPFFVRAMYHDDKFTYLQARPEETPTLYEIQDGKPNLISFDYKNGVYVTEKILDRGYLAIGKKKLNFTREE